MSKKNCSTSVPGFRKYLSFPLRIKRNNDYEEMPVKTWELAFKSIFQGSMPPATLHYLLESTYVMAPYIEGEKSF